MIGRIEETMERYGMFPPGEPGKVVAACSGGIDSMVMLSLLEAIGQRRGFGLVVAHVNHGLRGAEAEGDETFVREAADVLGLPFFSTTIDLKKIATVRKANLQESGRLERYRFFSEIADKTGSSRIALGHHADDQAETVLMRIVRGTGLKGLGGIPPVRGDIIRPLIHITREEIADYADHARIGFREDPSNRDVKYLRNRLRKEAIPHLKNLNPAFCRELCALAAIARDAEAQLDAEGAALFLDLSLDQENREGVVCLDLSRVVSLSPALKGKLLFKAIEAAAGSAAGFYSAHIAAVEALADRGESGTELNLPKGLSVRIEYGKLIFSCRKKEISTAFDYPLNMAGETVVSEAGARFLSEILPFRAREPTGADVLFLDAKKIAHPLRIRNFREGDRISLPGMTGRKKLKDLFIDEKVPREERRRIPLVVSGDEVLWVTGMRKSRVYAPGSDTTEVLRIAKS